MAWTRLPLCCSMLASMAWTMWFFYGLNYVFACACFHDTSIGHYHMRGNSFPVTNSHLIKASARPRVFKRGWGAIPLEVPRAKPWVL
jgi:hypothetical protein